MPPRAWAWAGQGVLVQAPVTLGPAGVAAFSARLREQVDLDTLSAELQAVVAQTMQPPR